MKCFRARIKYAYRPGHGSPKVAQNLHAFFQANGAEKIKIEKHEIMVTGKEKDRLVKLLVNWLVMIKSVQHILLEQNDVTQSDLDQAEKETTEVSERDYVHQVLWVAEGRKPMINESGENFSQIRAKL